MTIQYQTEAGLSPDEFIDVLKRSTLSERRPVDDRDRILQMLNNADVIITAREGGLLIGVSRAITDFCYCTYLSDLAVDERFQRLGIGSILIAAPAARSYYPHIGLVHHDSCWMVEPQ